MSGAQFAGPSGRDDICECCGDLPPTRALSCRLGRLSRVSAAPSGSDLVPADRRNVRHRGRGSQALKTQHLVVSCPLQPPHLGIWALGVEILRRPVDGLRTPCGRCVDGSAMSKLRLRRGGPAGSGPARCGPSLCPRCGCAEASRCVGLARCGRPPVDLNGRSIIAPGAALRAPRATSAAH